MITLIAESGTARFQYPQMDVDTEKRIVVFPKYPPPTQYIFDADGWKLFYTVIGKHIDSKKMYLSLVVKDRSFRKLNNSLH